MQHRKRQPIGPAIVGLIMTTSLASVLVSMPDTARAAEVCAASIENDYTGESGTSYFPPHGHDVPGLSVVMPSCVGFVREKAKEYSQGLDSTQLIEKMRQLASSTGVVTGCQWNERTQSAEWTTEPTGTFHGSVRFDDSRCNFSGAGGLTGIGNSAGGGLPGGGSAGGGLPRGGLPGGGLPSGGLPGGNLPGGGLPAGSF